MFAHLCAIGNADQQCVDPSVDDPIAIRQGNCIFHRCRWSGILDHGEAHPYRRTAPPYGEIEVQKTKLKILNPGAEGEQWIEGEFTVIDTGLDISEVVLAPTTAY